jgi:glycerophosphoryl diester phosphodiesterase
MEQSRPIVIAHRGASGHRPEHTLEAYRLAVEMGADYIEPDLVSTKDGVLVARHENEIGETTDAAAKFPDRQRTQTVDGNSVTGWFVEDFTLAELRTLRARERLASRSHAFDGQFGIPTFDDVIVLAQSLGQARGREVGIYPETKHPAHFRKINLALEDRLVAALGRAGWSSRGAPVFIQSFEASSLRELRTKTEVRLVQLVTTPSHVTDLALRVIASYAAGIGPEKNLVQPINADGSLGAATDLVARAHAAGLVVHAWTLRSDPEFLPSGYDGDPAREYRTFRQLGVDGIFTDYPDVATRAWARPRPSSLPAPWLR